MFNDWAFFNKVFRVFHKENQEVNILYTDYCKMQKKYISYNIDKNKIYILQHW